MSLNKYLTAKAVMKRYGNSEALQGFVFPNKQHNSGLRKYTRSSQKQIAVSRLLYP